MGEVYKAEDIKLSQTVALKFLPDHLQKDAAALARFHAEVRHARQVAHVNVCRVFDIGEIDGRHFLSMEYVDGDDLSSLLRRVGRFSSERAVELARQRCVGLSACRGTLFALGVVVALCGYGFYTSLGGQKVFAGKSFLED